MRQFDVFDFLDTNKWGSPIRLCELYGGIGSQYKALKNIGANVKEHYLVEVDVDATISYAAIHCDLDKHLSNSTPPKETMIEYLTPFNFRSHDKPANLSRINGDKLKKLYVATMLSNNLGDVGKLDDLPPVDLITWSTPCQDFSIAGSGKGFDGDRGGLTFVTLNLFRNLSYKPTFLLFENVTAITNKNFINGFNLMLSELESLGYTNHVMKLNARDYGIPQNRDRVYVLSVKNDHPLKFQIPKPKKTRALNDYIENQNAKFNLTDNQKQIIEKTEINVNINEGVFIASAPNSREYKGFKTWSPTLCARDYKDPKWVANQNGFRKMSPLEYFRLMGFDDQDFRNAEKHASNTTLYKQAGNSIVVQVLEAIFKNIFEGEKI